MDYLGEAQKYLKKSHENEFLDNISIATLNAIQALAYIGIAITERLPPSCHSYIPQCSDDQIPCYKCDKPFTPTEDGQCLCPACLGEEWGDTAPPSPGYDYDAMAEWQQEKQYRPVHDDTNA